MALTLLEQETVITWNRAEEKVNIYTADPYLIERLRKLDAYTLVREHRADGEVVACDFEASKKMVTLRNKTTALTEEQKKARREVLQKTMKGKQ